MAGSTTNPYADPTASAAITASTTPVKASQPSSFDNLMRDLGGIFSSTQPGESRKSILGMGNAAVDRVDDWLDYEAPELVNFATYALPYIGTMRLIQDATENREQGEWGKWAGDLGLAALSLVPGLGGVGAGITKSAVKGGSSIAKGIGKIFGKGEKVAKQATKSADEMITTIESAIGRNLTDAEKAVVKRAGGEDLALVDKLGKIESKGVGAGEGQFAAAGSKAARGQLDDFVEGVGQTTRRETAASTAERARVQQEIDRITKSNAEALRASEDSEAAISLIDEALSRLKDSVGKNGKPYDAAVLEDLRSILSPGEFAQLQRTLGKSSGTRARGIEGLKSHGDVKAFGREAPKAPVTQEAPKLPEPVMEEIPTFLGKETSASAMEEALAPILQRLSNSQQRNDALAQWLWSPRTRDGKVFKSSVPAWAGRGVVAGMGQANGPGTSPDAMAYYLQRLMQQQAAGEGMYRYYDPSRQ